jgi:uroporphyrinogen-III synthase
LKKSKLKNILISQPPPESEKSPYSTLVEKYHLNIDFRKFFSIEGVMAKEFRKSRINIQDYTAVILSSRNSVDHFFRIAKEMRVQIPDSMKYFCVSEAIAYYLQKYVVYRKRKIFHGKLHYTELMDAIKKHKSEKFLFPCSEVHKKDFPKMLEKNGINFKKAILYKTECGDLSDLDIHKYDMLVFFSPSGIKSLNKNFPDFEQNHTHIATFGKSTAKAAKDSNLNIAIEAPTRKAPSMTMAIEQFIESP